VPESDREKYTSRLEIFAATGYMIDQNNSSSFASIIIYHVVKTSKKRTEWHGGLSAHRQFNKLVNIYNYLHCNK